MLDSKESLSNKANTDGFSRITDASTSEQANNGCSDLVDGALALRAGESKSVVWKLVACSRFGFFQSLYRLACLVYEKERVTS